MRTRFTDLSQPEIIRPVASPVNSYVRPADPAPSPLHGLASGLADLSEGVSSFMGKRQQTTDKESAAKAEALFNANHQLGWAEAQKQGLIPAQYNPVFAKAYKQAQGNYAGVVLRQKFQKAYDAWDGKGSENPEDFNKFFSDFVAQNVDPNADPSVLEGLNPHVSKLMEDGTSMWTNDSSVAMRKRSDATHAALDGNDMDAAHEDPKPDYQKMWTNIQTRREAALASGTTAEAYDAGIVKSAAMKAVELDDEKLIDFIAKQPIPGNKDGLKYEDIPEFNDAIQQAKTQISTENRARKNFEYTQQERDDKKAREDLMIGVQTQLAIDPKATIPEEVYKKGEAAGWATMRKDVIDIKKSMLDDREAEDKRNILDLDIGITTGETTRETLWDAAKKGVIRDPQTWDRLQQKLKAYDEDKLKGYNLFDNERVKFWKQSFIQRSQTDGFASKVFGDSLALNDEAVQATGDYNGMLMDWIKANPEEAKNPANIYAKADEFGKIIAQRFDMKQLPDSGNRYRGTEDQANALFTAGAQDAKTTAFDKQKSDVAAPVPVSKWYQDNAPPNYKTLDPEAQKAIEDGAAAVGKSPEEFNKMLWENMKRWQEQQPQKDGMLQNQSSPIGNEVGGLIQTAYTDAQTQADNASVVNAGNGYTTIRNADGQVVKREGSLAWRNNNPGNLEDGPFARKQPGYIGSDGRFAIFSTPEAGDKAREDLLFNTETYSGLTVSEAINRYSPPNENNTASYIAKVTKAAGVTPDTIMRDMTPEQRMAFSEAQKQVEGFTVGKETVIGSTSRNTTAGVLKFDHPGQENISPRLTNILEATAGEFGGQMEVISGYRSPNHPVEAAKKNGGGEHTHRNAADISMRGMDEPTRAALVRSLIAKGALRFITYSKYPDMLHVDLKDQNGNGEPYFMHDKSAANLKRAPRWLRELAGAGKDISA